MDIHPSDQLRNLMTEITRDPQLIRLKQKLS